MADPLRPGPRPQFPGPRPVRLSEASRTHAWADDYAMQGGFAASPHGGAPRDEPRSAPLNAEAASGQHSRKRAFQAEFGHGITLDFGPAEELGAGIFNLETSSGTRLPHFASCRPVALTSFCVSDQVYSTSRPRPAQRSCGQLPNPFPCSDTGYPAQRGVEDVDDLDKRLDDLLADSTLNLLDAVEETSIAALSLGPQPQPQAQPLHRTSQQQLPHQQRPHRQPSLAQQPHLPQTAHAAQHMQHQAHHHQAPDLAVPFEPATGVVFGAPPQQQQQITGNQVQYQPQPPYHGHPDHNYQRQQPHSQQLAPPPQQMQQELYQQPHYQQRAPPQGQPHLAPPPAYLEVYEQPHHQLQTAQASVPPQRDPYQLQNHSQPPPQYQQLQVVARHGSNRTSRSIGGSCIRPLAVSHVSVSYLPPGVAGPCGSSPGMASSQPWLPLSNSNSSASIGGGLRLTRSSSLAREREAAEPESLSMALSGGGAGVPGWGVPPELEAQLDSMVQGSGSGLGTAQRQIASYLPSPSRGAAMGMLGVSGSLSVGGAGGGGAGGGAIATSSAGPAGSAYSPAPRRAGLNASSGGGAYDMSGMAAAMAATAGQGAGPAQGTAHAISLRGGGVGRSLGARGFGVPVAPLKMKQVTLASQEPPHPVFPSPPPHPQLAPSAQQPPAPPPLQAPSPLIGQQSGPLSGNSGSYPHEQDLLGTAAAQQQHHMQQHVHMQLQQQHHRKAQVQQQQQHQQMALQMQQQEQMVLQQQQLQRRASRRLMSSNSSGLDCVDRPQGGPEFQPPPPATLAPQQPPQSHPVPQVQRPFPTPFAQEALVPPDIWSGSWRQLDTDGGSGGAAVAGPSTSGGEGDSGAAGSTGRVGVGGSQSGRSADAEATEAPTAGAGAEAEERPSGPLSRRETAPSSQGTAEEGDAERGLLSGPTDPPAESDTASQSRAANAAAAAPSPRVRGGSRPAQRASAASVVAAAATAGAAATGGPTRSGKPRQRARANSTLADVIRFRLLPPGAHQLLVGNQDVVNAKVYADGRIETPFGEFRSLSSLALAVLRKRNPGRLACDGWQEVKLNGTRLDELRQEAARLLAQEISASMGQEE